jgi:hypothetical protein
LYWNRSVLNKELLHFYYAKVAGEIELTAEPTELAEPQRFFVVRQGVEN